MEHFTVEVNVKHVIPPKPIMNPNGYPVKRGVGGGDAMTERQVLDRLRVVVTAEDERDAISRAVSMLQTALPERTTGVTVANDGFEAPEHLHRASCHGAIGELQCGYPADGPSIGGGR